LSIIIGRKSITGSNTRLDGIRVSKARDCIMKDEIRSIEDICEMDSFSFNVAGNVYCRIALSKMLECPYHSSPEKDHNELYYCTHPLYTLSTDVEN